MTIVAALMIPGGMPLLQCAAEFYDRSLIYDLSGLEKKDITREPVREFRMNCLIGSALGVVLNLVYAIGLKSMVLLSNAYLVGAGLCFISIFVNALLITCCSKATNQFEVKISKPPALIDA